MVKQPNKRKPEEEEISSYSDESQDEDQFKPTNEIDDIDVNFSFLDPDEKDFHSVKNFIVRLLDGEIWDSSSLADVIISEQRNIGTMVHGDNNEVDSLFAMITALNFKQYAHIPGMQELKEHLLKKA